MQHILKYNASVLLLIDLFLKLKKLYFEHSVFRLKKAYHTGSSYLVGRLLYFNLKVGNFVDEFGCIPKNKVISNDLIMLIQK